MSWKEYVDSNLVGTGKVNEAAIIGIQGGVWAKSPGINLSPEEEKAIIAGFNKPDQVQASGIRIGGVKYMAIQAGNERIYGKKGADGVVVVKTKRAILIGIYIGPTQAGEATPVVEKLADYLIGVGY